MPRLLFKKSIILTLVLVLAITVISILIYMFVSTSISTNYENKVRYKVTFINNSSFYDVSVVNKDLLSQLFDEINLIDYVPLEEKRYMTPINAEYDVNINFYDDYYQLQNDKIIRISSYTSSSDSKRYEFLGVLTNKKEINIYMVLDKWLLEDFTKDSLEKRLDLMIHLLFMKRSDEDFDMMVDRVKRREQPFFDIK